MTSPALLDKMMSRKDGRGNGQKVKMKEPSRNIDRKKVFPGVLLLCLGVLLMLMGRENASPIWQVTWLILLGLGLFLYLWGRFFSRGED